MNNLTPENLSNMLQVTHRHNGTIIPPSADELNTMYWNIRSLNKKMSEVELCISSYPGMLHIIAISEIWLNENNYAIFAYLGYYAIHCTRINTKGVSIFIHTKGVSIFIHDSLCKMAPKVSVNIVGPDLNHFLVVDIPSINITVAVPYRRPGGNIDTFLDELQNNCLDYFRCIVMGDLLDPTLNGKLIGMLESNSFGVLNAVNDAAVTRLASNTILTSV